MNPRSWYWSHIPQMGRIRGLMEALDRIRAIERSVRLPPLPPGVVGRARVRALFLEVITCGRTPTQLSFPEEEVWDLFLLPVQAEELGLIVPHPFLFSPALGEPGVELLSLLSPSIIQIQCPYVWTPTGTTLEPPPQIPLQSHTNLLPLTPLPEGPPLESYTSSKSSYDTNSQSNPPYPKS